MNPDYDDIVSAMTAEIRMEIDKEILNQIKEMANTENKHISAGYRIGGRGELDDSTKWICNNDVANMYAYAAYVPAHMLGGEVTKPEPTSLGAKLSDF